LRQRRNFGICSHRSTIITITAGLAREVCEVCGHVSVSYVEPAVRLHPDIDGWSTRAADTLPDLIDLASFETPGESPGRTCRICSQAAMFMIPDGLMCDEHAWQAAARLDWDDADPWVPIRIG
jgi:hypothetical protein